MGSWLNSIIRVSLVLMCFTLEIQVRAEGNQWRHEPMNCMARSKNCAWLAREQKSQWQSEDLSIVAQPQSIVWWDNPTTTFFARGKFLVSAHSENQFATRQASFKGSGDFLLESEKDRTFLTVLKGEVYYQPLSRLDKEWLNIPEGFRVEIGGLMLTGNSDVEFPTMAPVKTTLIAWFDLYPGNKPKFLEEAASFVKGAPLRAELSAVWQKKVVEREIASEKERQRLAEIARRKEALEQAKLRALFRKMNYLSE